MSIKLLSKKTQPAPASAMARSVSDTSIARRAKLIRDASPSRPSHSIWQSSLLDAPARLEGTSRQKLGLG